MQDKFATDLAERCQAEFSQTFKKFSQDASHTHVKLLFSVTMAIVTYVISTLSYAWPLVTPPGCNEVHF